jgi:hypothetical protein
VHDLITSPAYTVLKVVEEVHTKTTAPMGAVLLRSVAHRPFSDGL